jgi:hypothetical protein
MKSEMKYSNATISTETHMCVSLDRNSDIAIFEGEDTTHKSIIIVLMKNETISIAVFWSHYANFGMLHTYWSETESVLFIGAGSVSATVNVKTRSIICQNYTALFWGWVAVQGFILEMGELDCRLYKNNGELVGETSVDPPYEYTVTHEAIIFKSCTLGHTSIKFNG